MSAARKPTHHRPGSPGKIDVLCARYEEGLPLWHDGDSKGPAAGSGDKCCLGFSQFETPDSSPVKVWIFHRQNRPYEEEFE